LESKLFVDTIKANDLAAYMDLTPDTIGSSNWTIYTRNTPPDGCTVIFPKIGDPDFVPIGQLGYMLSTLARRNASFRLIFLKDCFSKLCFMLRVLENVDERLVANDAICILRFLNQCEPAEPDQRGREVYVCTPSDTDVPMPIEAPLKRLCFSRGGADGQSIVLGCTDDPSAVLTGSFVNGLPKSGEATFLILQTVFENWPTAFGAIVVMAMYYNTRVCAFINPLSGEMYMQLVHHLLQVPDNSGEIVSWDEKSFCKFEITLAKRKIVPQKDQDAGSWPNADTEEISALYYETLSKIPTSTLSISPFIPPNIKTDA
jgi:hypothetical protein